MKSYILVILTAMALGAMTLGAFAVDSNKPSSHDISWLERHGMVSKADKSECVQCHTDEISCKQCHQEVKPRNHSATWTKKTHGLEARWDRSSCNTCHKEDSCSSCHAVTPPSTHRPGWGGSGSSQNRHCTSCHYPVQQTTCFVCHKTAHSPSAYQ